MEAGDKLHVGATCTAGATLHVSATVDANPSMGLMLMVDVLVCPGVIEGEVRVVAEI
jgi:hypothetical protein